MSDWFEPIRLLAALGFTGLLVMLRLEADRFGAAEYAETDRYGQHAPLRRRLAWYLLGLLLVVATWYAIPDPTTQLYLRLGDRGAALAFGLAYGALGVGQAIAFAWIRYRHLRLPAVASYPVALLNSVGTAFIDEACFRGAVLGFLILIGFEPLPAIAIQAIGYALATRLGAPGRNPYMLILSLGHRPRVGLRHPQDRRHRRGVPGPRDHPLRDVRGDRARGPAGAGRARGRGDREAPPDPRGLGDRRHAPGPDRPGELNRTGPHATTPDRPPSLLRSTV